MKSILLIGLGNFGKMVAQQITEMGHQVMAVDKDEKRVNEVRIKTCSLFFVEIVVRHWIILRIEIVGMCGA